LSILQTQVLYSAHIEQFSVAAVEDQIAGCVADTLWCYRGAVLNRDVRAFFCSYCWGFNFKIEIYWSSDIENNKLISVLNLVILGSFYHFW